MRLPRQAVARQIARAGYYATDMQPFGLFALRGTLDATLRNLLDHDPNFLKDHFFWKNHQADVGGGDCEGWRSIEGAYGWGSLQAVRNRETGFTFWDCDAKNPTQDVVGAVVHFWHFLTGSKVKGDHDASA